MLTFWCRHMAANPDMWDYSAAAIPSALTDDMERHQEARAVKQFRKCLQKWSTVAIYAHSQSANAC